MKYLKIICWLGGLFGISSMIIPPFLYPDTEYLPHHNFFIKYAFEIFFINLSVFLILIPYLMNPGTVTDDPFGDEVGKAKINFFGMSIIIPGSVWFLISLIITNQIIPFFGAVIAIAFIIYMYFVFAYQLVVKIKKKK